jgi:hypothetical protein
MASAVTSDMMIDDDESPINEEMEHLLAAIIHDNDDTTHLIIGRNNYEVEQLHSMFLLAIQNNSIRCIKYFIEVKGLDVNHPNGNYLNMAEIWTTKSTVDYLISKGAH